MTIWITYSATGWTTYGAIHGCVAVTIRSRYAWRDEAVMVTGEQAPEDQLLRRGEAARCGCFRNVVVEAAGDAYGLPGDPCEERSGRC
jgi:hypothetical protein